MQSTLSTQRNKLVKAQYVPDSCRDIYAPAQNWAHPHSQLFNAMFMSATEYSSACNAAHKVSCFQTVQQYKAVQLYRLASDWQYILMHAAIDKVKWRCAWAATTDSALEGLVCAQTS